MSSGSNIAIGGISGLVGGVVKRVEKNFGSQVNAGSLDNPKPGKNQPAVPPPRPPIQPGVMVVFGPHDKSDDPTLPKNRVITSKMVLPLTPSSIEVQVAGNWTDGLYPLRGNEHGQFAGGQLNTITFSGRLEPPAMYVSGASAQRLSGLSGYQVGQVSQIDPSAEYSVQQQYYGTVYGVAPPTFASGTDVVMMEGGLAPPGYTWHEPHDLAMLFESATRQGEIVRLIIGDQYGYNQLVSIRTFNWYLEDPDPDVINFDMTLREHRPRELATAPTVKHSSTQTDKSYTTKEGDRLIEIAQTVFGDPNSWDKLVQSNLRMFERLYRYPDGRAIAPTYFPTGESFGDQWPGHAGGHQVGTISRAGDGIGPSAYLRSGITLVVNSSSGGSSATSAANSAVSAVNKALGGF